MGVEEEPEQEEPDKVDTSQFLTPGPGPALPGFEGESELEEGDTIQVEPYKDPLATDTHKAIKDRPDAAKFADVPAIIDAKDKDALKKAVRTAIEFLRRRGTEKSNKK